MQKMKQKSSVWHPNTQMQEWDYFDKIVKGKGMWLIDSKGNKLLDGVGSMWCNVWGHSKKELINAIIRQTKKIPHSSLFNLTNEPAEDLAKKLIKISPNMNKVFYSDNGSTAMEIAFKLALQFWKNYGLDNKTKLATLENGYHGDTFGAMSVGYVPEFFSKFKEQLFSTNQVPVPNRYRLPPGFSFDDYQQHCLGKIETLFSTNNKIAAFVMESGAQVAGGVIIYPPGFQKKISKLCKKYDVLLILDEVATGFGRLGSLVQYHAQDSVPDIVAYGKMLTGGYLTMGATLTTKKIYNTSKIFEKRRDELNQLDLVGDVRNKEMLMGIELVKNKKQKTPISPKKSINKIIFDEGKNNGIYLRTLGNIVMLVPPLAISTKELDLLIDRTILTIKKTEKKYDL